MIKQKKSIQEADRLAQTVNERFNLDTFVGQISESSYFVCTAEELDKIIDWRDGKVSRVSNFVRHSWSKSVRVSRECNVGKINLAETAK